MLHMQLGQLIDPFRTPSVPIFALNDAALLPGANVCFPALSKVEKAVHYIMI